MRNSSCLLALGDFAEGRAGTDGDLVFAVAIPLRPISRRQDDMATFILNQRWSGVYVHVQRFFHVRGDQSHWGPAPQIVAGVWLERPIGLHMARIGDVGDLAQTCCSHRSVTRYF